MPVGMVLRVRIERGQQCQRSGIVRENPTGIAGEANDEHSMREPGLGYEHQAGAVLLVARSKNYIASVEIASEISSGRADHDGTAGLFRAAGDVEGVQADPPSSRWYLRFPGCARRRRACWSPG